MVAVAFGIAWSAGARRDTGHLGPGHRVGALEGLGLFRRRLWRCFTGWADELFELTEAVLCLDGPVTSLPELSLASVHRRSHGSIYQALGRGRLDAGRLRALLAEAFTCADEGPLKLAIDITPWPPAGRGVFAVSVARLPSVPLRRGPSDHPRVAVPGGGRTAVGGGLMDHAAGRGPYRTR